MTEHAGHLTALTKPTKPSRMLGLLCYDVASAAQFPPLHWWRVNAMR